MIICEVGLNHMGNVNYANEYVDEIIKAKADGILFHILDKSFYLQKKNLKFNLPEDFYTKAVKKLKRNNVKFGISLADPTRTNFCEKINVDFYKIFGGYIFDKELLNAIKKTHKKTFISTGRSNLAEIKRLIKSLKDYKNNFTLIHTQVDSNINVVNLKAIPMMREKFQIDVAYGNHAANTNVLFLALAFEPTDLIFYVKGSRFKKHVDDPYAIRLNDLRPLVNNLRELPKAIGKAVKLKMQWRI